MQNILAIDTCTEVCSVSLYTQGKITSRFVQNAAKSSDLILDLCTEVFAQTGVSLAAVDAIVYTKGPGAFTGVRLCVSVVQGISLAHNIPTMGFSTLEVLGFGAAQKYQSAKIAVALDARMGEVYWGVYTDGVLRNERLATADKVDILGTDFIGVGTGWGTFADELAEQTGIEIFTADFYPQAQNLIALCLQQKKAFDDKLPLPVYLRNNVAKKSLK
ncbi:MAG: tRNA (adenosine(37)-N6)-threonylcarbamoyltransferase complex dimerization subunit type 1 TsaB [Candidatus Thioglobus sp.]|nr:MAG: tRNA (adenosine(37)-N6)-threonylcarbamoyltransferase complex dimerization subunit type 1 TsaB [Candidatus Thioglobus sp.]